VQKCGRSKNITFCLLAYFCAIYYSNKLVLTPVNTLRQIDISSESNNVGRVPSHHRPMGIRGL